MSTATDRAYGLIRQEIREGALVPGSRLVESQLVDFCQVSRTPIREALRRLSHEGLVDLIPNAGAIVAKWSDHEIIDLYGVRARIEAMAASLAAQRRTPAELVRLRQLATQMQTLVIHGDPEQVINEIAILNNEFHHKILLASHSRAVEAAASQINETPLMLRTFQKYDSEGLLRSSRQHLDLVKAIEAHDSEWAGAIMRAHIMAGLDVLKRAQPSFHTEAADLPPH